MDSARDRTEQTDGRSAATPPNAEVEPGLPDPAESPVTAPPVSEADNRSPGLAKWLLIYTLLRVAMLAVLVGLLVLVMPLILALLFAVLLALPLSWLLFGRVRLRVNEALGRSNATRRAERERLRSALNGDDVR